MGNRSQLEEAGCPEAEYEFGVVADLDLNSRDPQEFIWSLSCRCPEVSTSSIHSSA